MYSLSAFIKLGVGSVRWTRPTKRMPFGHFTYVLEGVEYSFENDERLKNFWNIFWFEGSVVEREVKRKSK